MVPAHLIKLGQQALAEVTANVARGEPLVRCQLLASEFPRERPRRSTARTGQSKQPPGTAYRCVASAAQRCSATGGETRWSCSGSPPALLRPSSQQPLDAIQYALVVIRPLQCRPDPT